VCVCVCVCVTVVAWVCRYIPVIMHINIHIIGMYIALCVWHVYVLIIHNIGVYMPGHV